MGTPCYSVTLSLLYVKARFYTRENDSTVSCASTAVSTCQMLRFLVCKFNKCLTHAAGELCVYIKHQILKTG